MREAFDEIRKRLSERGPRPPLRPAAVFDPDLSSSIDALDASPAVRACLHLLNDDLDRAHQIAQEHEGDKDYDYLHAVVHRREGDFSNSKWWLSQVRSHRLWPMIYGSDSAAPSKFVDRCREAGTSPAPELEAFQLKELVTLLQDLSNDRNQEHRG